MEAPEAIFKRRSIRKYSGRPVEREKIMKLLESAMAAPSAGNQQPWLFYVADSDEMKKKIMDSHPYSKMLAEATCAIVVCGDLTKEKYKNYWPIDCSAATQNILITATALGLGAVRFGVYPREERVSGIKKVFDMPAHIMPLSIVSVGYPGEEKPPSNRFDPSRIFFEK